MQRLPGLPRARRRSEENLADELGLPVGSGLLENKLEILACTDQRDVEQLCCVPQRAASRKNLRKSRLARCQSVKALQDFRSCLVRPVRIANIGDCKRLVEHARSKAKLVPLGRECSGTSE